MSNRQTRRHPVHHLLTPLYPSNERILDDMKQGTVSNVRGESSKKTKKKGTFKRGRN